MKQDNKLISRFVEEATVLRALIANPDLVEPQSLKIIKEILADYDEQLRGYGFIWVDGKYTNNAFIFI